MMLATAITNLVLALMVQRPSVTVNNDDTFGISVETQYIHSVTLHEFDRFYAHNCKMCDEQIVLTPVDYLGAKPIAVYFDADNLRQYHHKCNPWTYLNPEITNGWFRIINSNIIKLKEDE